MRLLNVKDSQLGKMVRAMLVGVEVPSDYLLLNQYVGVCVDASAFVINPVSACVSLSGNGEIVPAREGYRICVCGWVLTMSSGTVQLLSGGTSGTELTGDMVLSNSIAVSAPSCLFKCKPNENLYCHCTAVEGFVSYYYEPCEKNG